MSGDWSTFGRTVLSDWDEAMDRFMERVDRKRGDLDDDEVGRALNLSFGGDVEDAWIEWCS